MRIGLIINPVAGIGGSVALKGSDGAATQQAALALGAVPQSNKRVQQALKPLQPLQNKFTLITCNADMGEYCAQALGFNYHVAYQSPSETTTAQDTENAVTALENANIDLLLFAGGDGTARNICNQVADNLPVLGIPAGCKIHSGVYTVTPKSAGLLIADMLNGELISLAESDVMDIDEALFREGRVNAKRYGEMLIPSDLRYVQSVKMGGRESEELVIADIAAQVIEDMEDELYLIGSGSTTAAIMQDMGLDYTLLGIDAVIDQNLVQNDLTESQILDLIATHQYCKLVITLIGGQGHLFGRGNQQLSPTVINKIGRDNIIVVGTKQKLQQLDGRPLICDTGDAALDQSLSGPIQVLTGYRDKVLYPVSSIK